MANQIIKILHRGNQAYTYPSLMPWYLQAGFDALLFGISFYLSHLLRLLLPIGRTVIESYSTPYISFLVLLFVIAGWTYVSNELYPDIKKGGLLLGALFLGCFCILAYVLMGSLPGLTSRLLFIYIFVITLFLFLLARIISNNLFLQVSRNPTRLKNLVRRTELFREKLQAINTRMVDRRFEIGIAIFCSAVAAWFLLRAGLGFSPDSTTYLRTALTLFDHYTLVQTPLWPPMYPIAISLFMFWFPFPADSAAFVSAISFGLSLVIFALLLRELSRSAIINSLVILSFATFAPFYTVFEVAFSETLFCLLVMCTFYFLAKHMKTGKYAAFLFAALFSGLAALTKYAGIPLLGSVFISGLLFGTGELALKKKLKQYLLPLAVAALPLFLWFIRNLLVSNTLAGENRLGIFYRPMSALGRIVATIAEDFSSGYAILFLAILVFPLFLSVRGQRSRLNLIWLLCAVLFVPYLIFLLFSASLSPVDIDTRFFSPFYFLFFVLIVVLYQHSLDHGKDVKSVLVWQVLPVFLFFSILVQIPSQLERVEDMFNRLSGNRLESVEQRSQGFSVSKTAVDINRYLSSVLSRAGDVVLSILLDDSNHYAPSFLYKSAIIQGPEYWESDFDVLADHDYQITLTDGPVEKSIFYEHINDLDDLEGRLSTLRSNSEYVLVVSESWLRENSVAPEDLAEISLLGTFTFVYIPPYWVFHLLR